MEQVLQILFVGALATFTIDIFAAFLKHGLNQQTTDWAMVGRWFAGLPRGIFVHRPIGKSLPVKNEKVIGWSMHYIIGVVYAGMYLTLVAMTSLPQPTLFSALIFGLATVIAPWLIMQPGLGMGILARNAPDPWVKRIISLTMHCTFGIALFIFWFVFTRFFY